MYYVFFHTSLLIYIFGICETETFVIGREITPCITQVIGGLSLTENEVPSMYSLLNKVYVDHFLGIVVWASVKL